ncbi:hypothetical protein HK103_000892 [Boothiomyces macroporosus]|uniref:Uncharacterized protein n=1 Tax=Boothiomyces macroporosus TaxID=261099 RepID=A0AAD5UKS4_9FUNG|nr:hypothetical protein HK103_000892 [Boothiomyces macroporosus]
MVQKQTNSPRHYSFFRNILLNFIFPTILFSAIVNSVSAIQAILISTILPVIQFGVELYKTKSVDGFSVVVVVSTIVTVVISVISHDPKFVQFKETIQNYLLSATLLVSSFFNVNLMDQYYPVEHLKEDFAETSTLLSRIWSGGFFLEATLDTVLVYTAPKYFVFLSPIVTVVWLSVLSFLNEHLIAKLNVIRKDSIATIESE